MATIQVRVSDEDKKAAEQILHALGMDLTTAVRVYLKKIVLAQGLPFSIRRSLTVNGFTPAFEEEVLKASLEAEKGTNLSPAFENAEDAVAWLHSADD